MASLTPKNTFLEAGDGVTPSLEVTTIFKGVCSAPENSGHFPRRVMGSPHHWKGPLFLGASELLH